ncbi:hypothetical protein SLS54_007621 [Diplodia seriata]
MPGAAVRQTLRKPAGRVMPISLLPTAVKETKEKETKEKETKAKKMPDEEGERTPSKDGQMPSKAKQTPSKVGQTPSKVGQTPSKDGQSPSKAKQTPSKVGQSPSKIKQTPHKPGATVVTPTTPKHKGDAAAVAAAASSGTPGSRTSGKKRGKGKELTKDMVVRPLPAPKQPCWTGSSPLVAVKEEKEEEEVSVAWSSRPWEEKLPHPFVRRSLFFGDPRYTFFD